MARCHPGHCLAGLLLLTIGMTGRASAQIKPPPEEDIPEEILRTEIIFEARSPLDGAQLTPEAYAELEAQLQAPPETTTLRSDIRSIVLLLQVRRAIKPILPFIP
ncbi:MAG: hypothetical protein AAGF01_25390 [Cyanobacteria bacterium P01_G01_bin.38]